MNTKRKLSLSGKLWFPIRKFEFTSAQNLSETLERIEAQNNTPKFGNHTYVAVNRKKINREYTFTWRKTLGENAHIYIDGEIIVDSDDDVTLRGKASVGNLEVLAIFFCTHFLVMGIIAVVMLMQSHTSAAFFVGIFPLGYVIVYSLMIRQREYQFNEFMKVIQAEKVKIKNEA